MSKKKEKVRIIWQNVNFKHRKDCKKKHIRIKDFTRASTSMMLAAWEWL